MRAPSAMPSQVFHHGADRSGNIPPPLRPRRLRTARTVLALIMREMSTTYGKSPGGYLWAVVEPVLGISFLTILLSVGLRIRTPSLGVDFAYFFAMGILSFALYLRVSGSVATALGFSKALLYYPAVTFIDAILARFILATITQLMVFYLVMTGIIVMFDTRAVLDLGPIVVGLSMAAALGLGIGCLNGFLFRMFPIWQQIWTIMTFPLFFMSTIIYIYEELPAIGQQVLWFNPLVHVIGMMRRGFFANYEAPFVSPAFVFSVAGITAVLGLALLWRYNQKLMQF